MYHSKYKYKHADRRLFPEKVEAKIKVAPTVQFSNCHFEDHARQQPLASLSQQQQAQPNHGGLNAFNGAAVGWPFGGLR